MSAEPKFTPSPKECHDPICTDHQTQNAARQALQCSQGLGKAHGTSHQCNPGHTAYFYCVDNTDPDSIYAFQQYLSMEASQEFLQTSGYAAYLKEVEPLLAGLPQVTALTPIWAKSA